jgi:hypothetical protein
MILAASVAWPDLMKVTRYAYGELSAGRQVPHTALRWILREAGLNGVFTALAQTHGLGTARDMILTLSREIDRQAVPA